jgi:hypothetical protein
MKSILNAWITDIKDARKKTTACQEVTRANPEKIDPNSKEKETAVEQKEIPNEEDMPKRDSSPPRRYGDGARSRKDAVRGEASRDPEGRCRSDAGRRTEEAA